MQFSTQSAEKLGKKLKHQDETPCWILKKKVRGPVRFPNSFSVFPVTLLLANRSREIFSCIILISIIIHLNLAIHSASSK